MMPTGLHSVQLARLMVLVPLAAVVVVVVVVPLAGRVVVAVPLKKVAGEDLESRERQRIDAELDRRADQIGPIAHPHNTKIVVGFVNPLVLYFQKFIGQVIPRAHFENW